jgi:hypothetical protein
MNEAIGTNVTTQQNAILAAREVVLTPGVLPIADGILKESGWPDQDPMNAVPAPAAAAGLPPQQPPQQPMQPPPAPPAQPMPAPAAPVPA